jgi:hypothetical protein
LRLLALCFGFSRCRQPHTRSGKAADHPTGRVVWGQVAAAAAACVPSCPRERAAPAGGGESTDRPTTIPPPPRDSGGRRPEARGST